MKVKQVEISTLKEAEYNPRKIGTKEFNGLKKSIAKFGLVKPLIYNETTGNLVGGNQRLKASRELGLEKVPVVSVELSEEEEKKLNLTLNNRGIQGEFTEEVEELLDAIKSEDPASFDGLRLFELNYDIEEELEKTGKEMGSADESKHPEMELQPYEHYDYVFIVCNDARDWNWLTEFLELEKVNASPVGKVKIGLMRGVWFEKFKKKLDEYKEKS